MVDRGIAWIWQHLETVKRSFVQFAGLNLHKIVLDQLA